MHRRTVGPDAVKQSGGTDRAHLKVNVTSDGKVSKRILMRGLRTYTCSRKCNRPPKGSLVTIWFNATCLDGSVGTFDSTHDAGYTFEIGGNSINRNRIVPGLEIAVQSMQKGEEAQITIEPEYGFGYQRHDDIPPNATLVYHVVVKDWTYHNEISKEDSRRLIVYVVLPMILMLTIVFVVYMLLEDGD